MVKVPKKWGGCSLNQILCNLGNITKEMGQQFEQRWNAFDQWRRKQLSKIVFTKLYRVLFSQYKKDSIDKAWNKMGTFHKLRQYNAATPQSWFTPVGWMEWRQYAGSLPTPTQLLGVAALYCWGRECPEVVEGWWWGVNQKL